VEALLRGESELKLHAQNDIYGNYDLFPPKELSAIKAAIICPATAKHIEKYRRQEMCVLRETAEDYRLLTLPAIDGSQFSLQWVENLLAKKAEVDRLIFENPDVNDGFLLYPDLKWDGKAVENLYVTAIAVKRGIKSMRDLNASHLPLLTNILCQGTKAIEAKYGVRASQLRIYVHYQPSYYHFHVHFTHLSFEAPGSTVLKAHLLADIIDNIRREGNFYETRTMHFLCKLTDPIYARFRDAGRLATVGTE